MAHVGQIPAPFRLAHGITGCLPGILFLDGGEVPAVFPSQSTSAGFYLSEQNLGHCEKTSGLKGQ